MRIYGILDIILNSNTSAFKLHVHYCKYLLSNFSLYTLFISQQPGT